MQHPLSSVVHGTFELAPAARPRRLRIVPDGDVDLLFSLNELPIAGAVSESAAVGLLTRAIEVTLTPEASVFGVTLSPHAARAVLAVPLSQLRNQVVDLTELLGRDARALRERIREAPDRTARARCVEAFLQRRLAVVQAPDSAIGSAIDIIGEHGGRLAMRAVSERIGLSERQLERLFAQHAGVSPKRFSRIARVQAALAHLACAQRVPNWGRLARDLGFADQPHMIREFRAITGLTPRSYVDGGRVSALFNTTLGHRASVPHDHFRTLSCSGAAAGRGIVDPLRPPSG
jgi:AraC-like DNA-binding protein